MVLSVGFLRFVSSPEATQATGFRLLPRWDSPPTEHASLSLVTLWPGNPNAPHSGGRAVIVVQQSTQALLPLDRTGLSHMTRFGAEELIADTLVRAFPMVMRDELGNGGPQRLFSEQNQVVQAGFFDTPDESLGERIQIGGAGR